MTMRDSVSIAGVPVHRVGYEDVLRTIGVWIDADPPGRPVRQICTVNPEFVVDAQSDNAFRQVLLEADLCVADGVGVAWAARILGKPVPERVTGSDGIFHICRCAAREGWRLFFLGAAPEVATRAATILAAMYPGLQIAGCYSGSPYAVDWRTVAAHIDAAAPDLIFVAFGHPKQDFWIHTHRDDIHAKVAIGVGGAFDFVAGIAPRAPVWMRRLGIEWLHRLATQPWRWRRMLKLPIFVWLVLRDAQ